MRIGTIFPGSGRFCLAFVLLLLYGGHALAALPVYTITITDGVYSPASIEVPPGQRFKIIIKNTGKGPAEFENLALRVEKVLAPEVESFVVIHPLKPGNYHFIDEFHLDMSGFAIVVTEPKN
ncbi:MAG: cupredoxin domain-containing protein [Candidatus Tokpelaia sp.]|nr:MAG: cupredoxin domain-containing protein [Candidatus Tokpelaia sp.]KAA6207496.1 MAG: cupredoxin domain-containing protein [Candidatus Tokpelaia sp.]